MNIKKQLRTLYLFELCNGIQITDVIWVFFLIQRGFSLAEAGLAEGFFHAVSMICEIPSGMISDVIGRRKTLIWSGIVSAASAWFMMASDFFPVILFAMGLNAISYNLVSGTLEALTYDSLLDAGKEKEYLKVSSRMNGCYQVMYAITSLTTLITVVLGYRIAYSLTIIQRLLCTVIAFQLTEAAGQGRTVRNTVTPALMGRELKRNLIDSITLLRQNPAVSLRMLISGLLSSGCYIVYMFLQDHLVDCGLPAGYLGLALFGISLFTVLGTQIAERSGNLSLSRLLPFVCIGTGICVYLSGLSSLPLVLIGACGIHVLEIIASIRIENENQKTFTSDNRATMVSVGSMVYSICMVILSPVSGTLSAHLGMSGSFLCLGIFLTAGPLLLSYLAAKRSEASS